jgi:hypothetical protein
MPPRASSPTMAACRQALASSTATIHAAAGGAPGGEGGGGAVSEPIGSGVRGARPRPLSFLLFQNNPCPSGGGGEDSPQRGERGWMGSSSSSVRCSSDRSGRARGPRPAAKASSCAGEGGGRREVGGSREVGRRGRGAASRGARLGRMAQARRRPAPGHRATAAARAHLVGRQPHRRAADDDARDALRERERRAGGRGAWRRLGADARARRRGARRGGAGAAGPERGPPAAARRREGLAALTPSTRPGVARQAATAGATSTNRPQPGVSSRAAAAAAGVSAMPA